MNYLQINNHILRHIESVKNIRKMKYAEVASEKLESRFYLKVLLPVYQLNLQKVYTGRTRTGELTNVYFTAGLILACVVECFQLFIVVRPMPE